MCSAIVHNVPLCVWADTPGGCVHPNGFGTPAAVLEHVPFFRGKDAPARSQYQQKADSSKMPGIRKDRAYAAWVKSLAK